jgi:hypothetical protein
MPGILMPQPVTEPPAVIFERHGHIRVLPRPMRVHPASWYVERRLPAMLRESGALDSGMAITLLRDTLVDDRGNDVGWLYVVPRPEHGSAFAEEVLVPLFGVGLGLSPMLYSFMLPLWVYLDARGRTTKAVPLALFVWMTNFIGWLTYLVIRPDADRLCPGCDSTLDPGFRVCPMCGWTGSARCHSCGRPARPDWRFCPYCEAARPDVELGAELGPRLS